MTSRTKIAFLVLLNEKAYKEVPLYMDTYIRIHIIIISDQIRTEFVRVNQIMINNYECLFYTNAIH